MDTGIACIDAPMSGGPLRARDGGTMILVVACAHGPFERHETVLQQMSTRPYRLGERPATAG